MYIVGPVNSIIMATIIILFHTAQNTLTGHGQCTMSTVITRHAFVNISHKTHNPLTTANDMQPHLSLT